MSPDVPSEPADQLQRAVGWLTTAATERMESETAWFAGLSAQDRSWVGLIMQAGVRGFVDWYRTEQDGGHTAAGAPGPARGLETTVAAEVFGAAPRALTRVINLQQTVELVRLGISVVEDNLQHVVSADDLPAVRAAILRYSREVAFATAEVYARAAEQRGAWDARLEALVVDAVMRPDPDDAVLARAGALGWTSSPGVRVLLGSASTERADTDVFAEVRRLAQEAGQEALCAVLGQHLVVVLGGVDEHTAVPPALVELFGPGPVVVGPRSPDLPGAYASARAARAGLRAAAGWPDAPRPVAADDLLPERCLDGDTDARDHLVSVIYPLLAAREHLVETLDAWFTTGGLEATARRLYCHPNTVRYRLRQVAELTGYTPTERRQGLTVQLALTLGRQQADNTPDEL